MALPIFPIDYFNIINLISQIKKNNEFDIIIKTHPEVSKNSIDYYVKKLNSFISSENISKCLNKSDLVIKAEVVQQLSQFF